MKILILGASGYAGRYIKDVLQKKNDFVIGTYRTPAPEFENDSTMVKYTLEGEKELVELLKWSAPDIVISCLNGDFGQQIDAYRRISAYLAEKPNKKFIFLSTSNVFDGALEQAHVETDLPKAQSDYGKFKIQCEELIKSTLNENGIIIRIPEIWGIDCPRLKKVEALISEGKPVPTFKNIYMNYTTNQQIANWIDYMIENDLKGIFHVGTKNLSEYTDFYKSLISTLQLGNPVFEVIHEFPEKQIQAVVPNRSEILPSMQMEVKDVIAYMNSIRKAVR